jgi:hypothetical protein
MRVYTGVIMAKKTTLNTILESVKNLFHLVHKMSFTLNNVSGLMQKIEDATESFSEVGHELTMSIDMVACMTAKGFECTATRDELSDTQRFIMQKLEKIENTSTHKEHERRIEMLEDQVKTLIGNHPKRLKRSIKSPFSRK